MEKTLKEIILEEEKKRINLVRVYTTESNITDIDVLETLDYFKLCATSARFSDELLLKIYAHQAKMIGLVTAYLNDKSNIGDPFYAQSQEAIKEYEESNKQVINDLVGKLEPGRDFLW